MNGVQHYAKAFCNQLGVKYDKRTIVVTALTGVAATAINGKTVHSAAKLQHKAIKPEHVKEWKDARLLIIDEISFSGRKQLIKIDRNLRELREMATSRFGKMNIVFAGDFRQLEPIAGDTLYEDATFIQWFDWINCMIELRGNWRFLGDPEFGKLMERFHDGQLTNEDFDLLDTRVVNASNGPSNEDLPDDMAYACYTNKDRNAINAGLFLEHLRATHSQDRQVNPPNHTIVIRGDDMEFSTTKKLMSMAMQCKIWGSCGDSKVRTRDKSEHPIDPFLKVHLGIPLMHTENEDVPNGIANGTLCSLDNVVLNPGVTEDAFTLMQIDGYWVRCIDANNVQHLVCKFEGDNSNDTFNVLLKKKRPCRIAVPMELFGLGTSQTRVNASITQFPVLINHATTGHKLQGMTKSSLFVSSWSYVKNWPYVVLSRVTSLKGLFLRNPIDRRKDFTYSPKLRYMMNLFRRTKAPMPYEPEE